MTPCTACPSPDQLRGLLSDRLSDPEQTRLVEHLDVCEGCQRALDRLASGDTPMPLDAVKPPADSAFWPALAALRDDRPANDVATRPDPGTSVSRDVRLDFLAPPVNPGTVGKLGTFDVLGVVGQGGMGLVLHGFDPCLQRPVALKVLDPNLASNEMAHQRFCREARAAAAITHENVVAVYEVDEDEKRDLPYLVMQLIAGESLEGRLQRGRLEVREVVRIAFQAAAGLAAAHEKGLIHRDVKPGNILIENGTGRVKITDFGLARATEDVKLTRTGFVAGTPLYMSPEQALGKEVGPRSDLFSLGVVLYEACAGQPPFTAETPLLVLKRLTEEIHPPLRRINPNVPEWLEALIDRLLSKRPEDRPGSAAEVAQELATRLATLEPLSPLAVPALPSGSLEVRRASRRGRRLLWLALAAVVVGSMVGTAVWLLTRPTVAKPVAVIEPGTGPVWSVAFSPDGKTLALALDDGRVRLWDREQGRFSSTLSAHKGPVWGVAFAPGSGTLASASDDGTVKLWRPGERQPSRVLEHGSPVRAVTFSPDGRRLLTGGRNGQLLLWDVEGDGKPMTLEGHAGVVVGVAFSPDGKTVASGGGDKTVRLWDVGSGKEVLRLDGHTGAVHAVAFSPDGRHVASGSWDHVVRLWEADSGNAAEVWSGHSQDVWSIAFSPDGRWLASASEDRTVKLWDVRTGRVRHVLTGHTGTLYAVAFSSDGALLASGGRDGSVRLWHVDKE